MVGSAKENKNKVGLNESTGVGAKTLNDFQVPLAVSFRIRMTLVGARLHGKDSLPPTESAL